MKTTASCASISHWILTLGFWSIVFVARADTIHLSYADVLGQGSSAPQTLLTTLSETGVFLPPMRVLDTDANIFPVDGAPVLIGGGIADSAVDGNGELHHVYLAGQATPSVVETEVVYVDPSGRRIAIAEANLTDGEAFFTNPAVAVDDFGVVHVIFYSIRFAGGSVDEGIEYTNNASGAFASPQRIVNVDSNSSLVVRDEAVPQLGYGSIADLDVSADGSWHVAHLSRTFEQNAVTTAIHYVSETTSTLTVASETETASDFAAVGNPLLVVKDGAVAVGYVTKSATDAPPELVVHTHDGSGFSAPESPIVFDSNLSIFNSSAVARKRVVDIDLDSVGRLHVVFVTRDSVGPALQYIQSGMNPVVVDRRVDEFADQRVFNPSVTVRRDVVLPVQAEIFDAESGATVDFVAADGAARIHVEIPVAAGTSANDVALEFVVGDAASDQGRLGVEEDPQFAFADAIVERGDGSLAARFAYRPPAEFLPGSGAEPDDSVRDVFLVATIDGLAQAVDDPIRLVRPPVVVLHDQWGRASDWRELRDRLLERTHVAHLHDYSLSNDTLLDGHSDTAMRAIDMAKTQARNRSIGVAKVDVVAHGMGGLLARLYAQDQGAEFYRDDIRKLVTIGAAHSGSPWGSLLPESEASETILASLARAVTGRAEATGQSVREQALDAPAIDGVLNRPGLTGRNGVPTHAIALATSELAPNTFESALVEGVFFALRHRLAPEIADAEGFRQALFSGSNDGFSSTGSQRGGLPAPFSETWNGVTHTGAAADTSLHDLIAALLDLPVDGPSSVFAPTGIVAPPDLEADFAMLFPQPGSVARKGSLLTVDGPLDHETFAAGAAVTVSGALLGDAVEVVALWPFGFASSSDAAFELQLPIPIDALGPYSILVSARTVEGVVQSAEIPIAIGVGSDTVDFALIPDGPLSLFRDERYATQSIATFADGVERVLGASFDVEYGTTAESVAAVESGVITAHAPGTTLVTASADNVTAELVVDVVERAKSFPLDVSPVTLEFGTIPINTRKDLAYLVTNNTDAEIIGEAAATGIFRIVFGADYRIFPDQTHEVVVRFDPPEIGIYTGEIRFTAGGSEKHALILATAVLSEDEGSGDVPVIDPSACDNGAGAVIGAVNRNALWGDRAVFVAALLVVWVWGRRPSGRRKLA